MTTKKTIRTLVSLLIILILVGCSPKQTQPPETAPPAPNTAATPLAESTATTPVETSPEPAQTSDLDLTQLWSYGLTSIRTGEPIIEEGGEHKLDESLISYGYNLVVDRNGNAITPSGAPLHGGEQLVLTEAYQDEHNVREYARIYTIMAPIRDALLYHFESMSRDEWLEVTAVLTLNNIKTENAATVDARSLLSTEQVYDYVASGEAEGSAIMRYFEEAELELKCLAFQDFDFTNPEGQNHCTEHGIAVGSGIKLP